jgi:hypothetical protein
MLVLFLALIYVWVRWDQVRGLEEWLWVLVVGGAATYLSMAHHRLMTTWRGFDRVILSLALCLLWLNSQWSLWNSSVSWLRNLNAVVGFLIWGLLIAGTVSTILMLVRRDTSVVFLAAVWVILPIWLLWVGREYNTIAELYNAPFSEQLMFTAPIIWSTLVICCAPPLFLAHLVWLGVRELRRT